MSLIDKLFWSPNYNDYYVTDVETTINAPPSYKFPADPRYKGNKVVLGCTARVKQPRTYFTQIDIDTWAPAPNGTHIAVGHNIKFDMQYLKNVPRLCWDTGIAYHILSGHKAKMPSLNEVGAAYGLGTKTVPMDVLWDMGFKTEDMDPEFLQYYLDGDITLTEDIYLKQLELTAKTPLTRLLIMHCSMASLALGDAEMTGLPMNVAALQKLNDDEFANAEYLIKECTEYVAKQYSLPPGTDIPLTPKYLGLVLHEQPIMIESVNPVKRVLKSGKIAKRHEVIRTEYKSAKLPYTVPPVVLTASKSIKVDEDVLAAHEAAGSPIAKAMREIRGSQKLVSTYTAPALAYMRDTGFTAVHTKFNQTVTNTGRTSSTNPNIQNMPPEIEACVRPDKGEYLVKADFSQLQMCGIAMLSGDEQLIHDINHDVDIHYETGKVVYGWKSPGDMEKATRRKVKNVNFGLIFHGSPGGLSAQTGVDIPTIKRLIHAFKARYPLAYQYGIDLKEKMEDSARPAEGAFINGVQQREAFTMTPAGRLIRYVEREAPPWLVKKTGKPLSFSPNEIANYPVQGYSDGDLAIQFLAYMYWNGLRIINLVHDSYWFLTKDYIQLENDVTLLLTRFNAALRLKVPLQLDFSVEDSDGNKIR